MVSSVRAWAAAALIAALVYGDASHAVVGGSSKKGTVILRQTDFDAGTVFLDKKGATYRLGEDISFRPLGDLQEDDPESWMYPDRSSAPYNSTPFRLGFFTAIAITADDITFDLNGFTLEQSQEHATMQRFFSLIELASMPFPADKGPATFGGADEFKAAKNVRITNGVLGRSSHHGIHGNSNTKVFLDNLEIRDFEVAGVALNNVDRLRMKNVDVRDARADVSASPALSHSIFLLQAVSKFLSAPSDSAVAEKATALRTAVYDFLKNGDDSYGIFTSRTDGLPDGSLLAGIMIASKFNVGDFETEIPDDGDEDGSFRVVLRNVHVSNLTARPQESAILKYKTAEGVDSTGYGAGKVVDIVSAAFDVDHVVAYATDYSYQANPLADLQLAVAAYALECQATNATCNQGSEGRLLARNKIPQEVIDWSTAANPASAWDTILASYTILPNQDAMGHFSKGIVGLKLDGISKARIKSVEVSEVTNAARSVDRSPLALAADPDYLYQGFAARGVSVAASVNIVGESVQVSDIVSVSGSQVCVDAINRVLGLDMRAEGRRVVKLWQSDFDKGTLVLKRSNTRYVLGEDIVFRPQGDLTPESPETWMFPSRNQQAYTGSAFRLGFFAAITLSGYNVVLDLNGYTLSQSVEHANVQRFFALIELASSPFPPNQGPASFGGVDEFKAARRVRIENGVLGLSSHHGIHGNHNVRVTLQNLEIRDFEVAGVALNRVHNLRMRDVYVHSSRTDVPSAGALSQSVFLLQASRFFLTPTTAISEKAAALRTAVYNFLNDGSDPSGLFSSQSGGLPDGSLLAGVMVSARLNIGLFETETPYWRDQDVSRDVQLKNVVIENLVGRPRETGALKTTSPRTVVDPRTEAYQNGHASDIIAAVFDVDRVVDIDNNFAYVPTPLADLQLAVAEHAITCLSQNLTCGTGAEGSLLKRNGISQAIVDWSKSDDPAAAWAYIQEEMHVVGNHDVQFHHNKGIKGLKLEGTFLAQIENVKVSGIVNLADSTDRSPLALDHDPDYVYEGFTSRGVVIAAALNVAGDKVEVTNVTSVSGPHICLDAVNHVPKLNLNRLDMECMY
ncbi:Hypothetical Protein FCC1311_036452 [Hondaea fermentalgiana]|uniref:Uncharacterized protein n=1 Tax=Hondaea fermentalgiana TaxID=2315210 RepID=A0A2R5GHS1_9STRA|nr:Hypothetical Protein FCC1311_036452 [Hondaea fermentalgiana]|eukprot:GBG27424.1 Hypothetical Protein FCC1311_036452 [Hondaea fermentalgiana]